jgi:hypothetical protein
VAVETESCVRNRRSRRHRSHACSRAAALESGPLASSSPASRAAKEAPGPESTRAPPALSQAGSRAAQGQIAISVLSSRYDLVSGGDALVEVKASDGAKASELKLSLNGRDLVTPLKYDQPTNTWTSSTMATARSLHSATRLADGRVVVCGGAQGSLTLPVAVDGVEVYSPTTNGWASLAALPTPRMAHASALLPDGTIVLLGGQDAVGTTAAIALLRL